MTTQDCEDISFRQGYIEGNKAPNYGTRVGDIYRLAERLGYAEGTERFNKFISGYNRGYSTKKEGTN